jgi:AcrR family transcriptional regulator
VRRHYHRAIPRHPAPTPEDPPCPAYVPDDYDAKTHAILDSAAALFAKVGYPSAKMQDIAKACGATKSMLYHYFPTKDDLLYAMLEEHLQRVIVALEEALAGGPACTPHERFAAFVLAYTQKSAQSRRRHVSAMNDVKFLPKACRRRSWSSSRA